MAEKFALDQFRRNRSTVHLDIWHCRTVALLMKVSRHEFLTGSVCTCDKNASVGRCHLVNHLLYMKDCRRLTHHRLTVNFLFEDSCLLYERHLVGSVLDGNEDSIEIERLRDEVECAFLDTFYRCGDVSMSRNHDDSSVTAHFRKFVKHLDSVHSRHLDITEDDAVFFFIHH